MFHAQRSRQLIQIFPPKLKLITSITIATQFHQEQSINSIFDLLNLSRSPEQLKQIHGRLFLYGLHQCPALSCKLIDSYANLGHLSLSQRVFESNVNPPKTLRNRILENLYKFGEYGKCLSIFRQMDLRSVSEDECTHALVLRSCNEFFDVKCGEMLHGRGVKLGFDSYDFVKYALLDMHRKYDSLCSWREPTYERLVSPVNYWNSLIFEALQDDDFKGCFRNFANMRKERVHPDSLTIVNLLRACVDLNRLHLGRMIHALALISNLCEDLLVNTALLTMYSKMRSLVNARLLFEKMPQRDTVVWNLMISAYSRHGCSVESLELLMQMVRSGIRADLFTALAAITSIAELKSLKQGKEIHAHVIRNGSDYQVSVLNCLMDMYCQSGCLLSAQKIFNSLHNKTVVSWSSMIKGYVSHEQFYDALFLFNKMRIQGFRVDSVTVINVLPACVNVGALQQIKYLHGYSIKSAFTSEPAVSTALLASYAKCGCIELARKLFDDEQINSKDIITWNSMINAYAKHGHLSQCFELHNQMNQQKVRSDQVTFLGLLTACVNSGSVKQGLECFREMTERYGFQPSNEHYACMVDLLARAGHIKQAFEIINSMPLKPDSRVWGPLLAACKIHTDTSLAEFAAERLITMEPENAGNYVLLSNIYAASKKWDGVAKMRIHLRDKGLKKTPGCSWVEMNGQVHEFRAADKSHHQADAIYAILQKIEMEFMDLKKSSEDVNSIL